ncbi:tetratricopeptide repeat [Paramuricea clavata]|uniref:Tetratricopeptide repeat n=1 Tax=Paramuricea clavata TaxID=317549 RepID=A0A7D9JYP7_PARCT|nr:tetratricopeptide repeat [Paramuricea clavata]
MRQLTQLQILKELGYLYLEATDYPKSIEYAQKLLNLADMLNVQNFKADADYLLGTNYAHQNSFEKALSHLDAYKQYCHETADELGKAKILLTRSQIACQRHEDETFLLYAKNFLEKAKTANDEILETKALVNLAIAHLRLFDIQKSLHFSEKCLQLAKKNCHAKLEIESKFSKATAYLVLGENEKAYCMLMECLKFLETDHKNKDLESMVLGNISYAARHLSQKYDSNKLRKEALVFIQRTLSISESIGNSSYVALGHLNIGLTYMECYEDYNNAIKHFHEGLRMGAELKITRLIHNCYCSLGRLHEAKGERQVAHEYFTKALETIDPPCTHWGEADNLQFSPDYWLALQHISGKKWKDAVKCLQGVIQRCKRQGKSVSDSLLKISFNDKLTKPYQYLQYAYLEMEATKDALVIGEEGRARDFYDKLVDRSDNIIESTPNPDLFKISKAHNTAVLFLSQLTVVGRVYCWFIGSDGRIVDVFWVSQDKWKPLHTKLCVIMHEFAVQWENSETSIEYRGVETLEDDTVVLFPKYLQSLSEHTESSRNNAFEKDVLDPVSGSKHLSSRFAKEESNQSITGANESILRSNHSSISRAQSCFSLRHEAATSSKKGSTNPIEELSKITNEIR